MSDTPSAQLPTSPEALFARLADLGIAVTSFSHPPVHTVEEAKALRGELKGGHIKNLFLRNKKGDRHYLVVVESHKQVDLKALRGALGESTLSFASPQRLMASLGLHPGSVSPFGLINDRDKAVRVVMDRDLLACDVLNFHPNVNTATLSLSRSDFERFLEHCGHEVRRMAFDGAAVP